MTTNRPYKVWGTHHSGKAWNFSNTIPEFNNRQPRAIVAARTQKAAAEALGMSASHLRNYGSDTGNEIEIAQAMTKPGTVFVYRDNRGTHPDVTFYEVPA